MSAVCSHKINPIELEIGLNYFADWYTERLILLKNVPPILNIAKYSHLLLYLIDNRYEYYEVDISKKLKKNYVLFEIIPDRKKDDIPSNEKTYVKKYYFTFLNEIHEDKNEILDMFYENAYLFGKDNWKIEKNLDIECPQLERLYYK